MANWRLIVNHVKVSEGGHSADPDDNALKYGHSGVLGGKYDPRYPNNYIHTNKGVIWSTYKSYKQKKGQKPTANDFINMSDKTWLDIMKTQFWDWVQGDDIKSQGVAEILFEAAWGGGLKSMVYSLQSRLAVNGYKGKNGRPLQIDGAIGENTIYALNNYTKNKENEESLVRFLAQKRLEFLQNQEDWGKYKYGWTDRVNKVLERALSFVGKRSIDITAVLIIAAIGYFAYKTYYQS